MCKSWEEAFKRRHDIIPEKIEMFKMSEEEYVKKTMPEPLIRLEEERCRNCNRLLGKFNGQVEIKCPKCGEINRIGVNLPKDKVFDFLETEKRISQERINEYAECFDGVPVNDHTRKELLKSHIRFCDRILKLLN